MTFIRPKIDPFNLSGLKTFEISGELDSNVFLTGVNLDSNQIHAGDLFVALSGEKTHGAAHASQAINKGAAAILTDEVGSNLIPDSITVPVLTIANLRKKLGDISSKIFVDASRMLKIFGLTGSNG
ncbi:MAG: Mur ligase domain-containing protein [Candidatus Nanopelagicales bacterium]